MYKEVESTAKDCSVLGHPYFREKVVLVILNLPLFVRQPLMTRRFIMDAVETRLRMIVPYLDTWPQAMAIMALPNNSVTALKNLAQLVDEIWYYAGDRSVDVSVYFLILYHFLRLWLSWLCPKTWRSLLTRSGFTLATDLLM